MPARLMRSCPHDGQSVLVLSNITICRVTARCTRRVWQDRSLKLNFDSAHRNCSHEPCSSCCRCMLFLMLPLCAVPHAAVVCCSSCCRCMLFLMLPLYAVPHAAVVCCSSRCRCMQAFTFYFISCGARWFWLYAVFRTVTDTPILGVVPWAESLDQPSTMDLEILFNTTALAGRQHLLRRCVTLSSSRGTNTLAPRLAV